MGGGKGGKDAKEPEASKAQARIAQQMYNQTQPLRNMLISDSISFLGGDPTQTAPGPVSNPFGDKAGGEPGGLGGAVKSQLLGADGQTPALDSQSPTRTPFQYNAAGTPEFQFVQGAANRRFDQAKENILANTAPGGGLAAALAGADLERANTLTGAEADIFNQNINRAFSLATGQPFTGGGLGQAGAIQAQIAAANANQNAAAKGGIGSGIGMGIGYQLGAK